MKPEDLERDAKLEREAKKVLEPLRYSPIGISSSRQVEAGRSELVPHLARIIERVPVERAERRSRQLRWRRTRWVLAGSFAVAAVALAWLGAPTDSPIAAGESAQLELVSGHVSQKGTQLRAGIKYAIDSLGRLSTPHTSGARFVTDSGVDLGFGADSTADLSFTQARQQIALNRGRVELSVPKLKAGTSLSVATPDAVVTVHGTRFSVEVMPERTCVRVSEGVVSVVRGDARELLTRGQSSGCAPADRLASGSAARLASAPASELLADKPAAGDPSESRSKPKSALGTLDQENRLFQSALRAEQSGDRAEALALATKLLARYPSSVMAPDARRIIARVRQQTSLPRAP